MAAAASGSNQRRRLGIHPQEHLVFKACKFAAGFRSKLFKLTLRPGVSRPLIFPVIEGFCSAQLGRMVAAHALTLKEVSVNLVLTGVFVGPRRLHLSVDLPEGNREVVFDYIDGQIVLKSATNY